MEAANLYYVILSVCFLLFLSQFIQIWIDYGQGKTAISMSDEPHDQKQLPCLTICPLPAFKNYNQSELELETNPEIYMAATWNQEEIFSQNSLNGKSTEWMKAIVLNQNKSETDFYKSMTKLFIFQVAYKLLKNFSTCKGIV